MPGFNYGKKVYYSFGRIKRHARNMAIPTAHIFLYHRIAGTREDPHLLCVNPENFRTQIKFLKENFKIIPLVKLVQDIQSGRVHKNSVVITFDDGYADNLYNALPILDEFKAPATVFLTAGYIGQGKSFHWDQNTPLEDRGRPMTLDEAKSLSNSPFIELGGHTLTHPRLAKLAENEQFREVSESKKILENNLDIPLLSFAYPFGGKDSFNEKTIEVVKKAGYHYACSNIHERATKGSDIYALPRFIIRNWGLEEFKKHLKNFI